MLFMTGPCSRTIQQQQNLYTNYPHSSFRSHLPAMVTCASKRQCLTSCPVAGFVVVQQSLHPCPGSLPGRLNIAADHLRRQRILQGRHSFRHPAEVTALPAWPGPLLPASAALMVVRPPQIWHAEAPFPAHGHLNSSAAAICLQVHSWTELPPCAVQY